MATATQATAYASDVLAMIEPSLDELGSGTRVLLHPRLEDGFEVRTRRVGAPSEGAIVVTAHPPHIQRVSHGPRFSVCLDDWWGDTGQARWYRLTASEAASLVLNIAQYWPQRSYNITGYATAATPFSRSYLRYDTLEALVEAHPRRQYAWELRVERGGKHRAFSERRYIQKIRAEQELGPDPFCS